eukprot:CAMPEP_0181230120 /NCGR_PEP_ID=MMETSP1096-20121128/34288_1 /TAXON_ID=156174 ORGANISM="Chrysochromulina ericina, Strain CCMP281" /NCGR_SAMPLE_ID=MMETSP1096 /ASSEMBLY_ACC=CAM_ASM_000453 /LENGTH=167 /DNA_ID=CAMNT_0023323843 /DNA_START=809 /DNA_END=1309 /DNA_ORIENTATION=-
MAGQIAHARHDLPIEHAVRPVRPYTVSPQSQSGDKDHSGQLMPGMGHLLVSTFDQGSASHHLLKYSMLVPGSIPCNAQRWPTEFGVEHIVHTATRSSLQPRHFSFHWHRPLAAQKHSERAGKRRSSCFGDMKVHIYGKSLCLSADAIAAIAAIDARYAKPTRLARHQ